MKRIIQFGLLAVLIELPYLVTTTVTLLLIGVPSNDVIVLKPAGLAYSYLRALLSYKYSFAASIILLILWYVFVIRWAWKLGFINKARLSFWRSIPEYWKNYKVGKWEFIARLIAAVLVFVAGYFSFSAGFGLEEKYPFTGTLTFLDSFRGPASILEYMLPSCVPVIPVTFSCATLAYVIMVPHTLRDLRMMLVVPVTGILATGLLLLLIVYARNYIDYGKEINIIPHLSFKPESRQLLLLTNPAESGKSGDIFQDDDNPFQKGTVPFSDQNEKVIKQYLQSRNFRTCLRGAGYSYLQANRMRELDPRGAALINKDAFFRTGNSMQGFFLLIRIAAGPSNDSYYNLLKEISDETAVSVKGKSALKVSRAFAKFGELEKARYWYKKGIETGNQVTDEDKKSCYPPAQPPFYRGRITGRFTLEGMPLADINVGLIKEKSAVAIKHRLMEKGGEVEDLSLINLTDGTVTDKEGRVTFDHLGEGDYIILLSLEGDADKKVNIINSPGVVRISEGKPTIDLGIIRVELLNCSGAT